MFYEQYARSEVMFPRVRLDIGAEEVEELPRKTRPIARALIGAWDTIDTERATHKGLVSFHINNPSKEFSEGKGRGIIVGSAGKNAVEYTVLAPLGDVFELKHELVGPMRPSEREAFLTEMGIPLADGRILEGHAALGHLENGPEPDVNLSVMIGEVPMRIVHFDASAGV
jgi:hypothetical protein